MKRIIFTTILIGLTIPATTFCKADSAYIDLTAQINLLIDDAMERHKGYEEQAVVIANKAVTLAQKVPDDQLSGKALYALGFIHYRLCNMDSALLYLNESLVKMEAAGDSTGIGISMNRIGNVYWYLNEQGKAKHYFEQARDIHARLGNDKELGQALTNLGSIYRHWAEYRAALRYYLDAGEHYRKCGYTEGFAWLNFSVTMLYKELKNYDKALESINRSLELYQDVAAESGDSTGMMLCFAQLGDIYMQTEETDKALEYHFKALRMRKNTRRSIAIADGLMGVGQVYYKRKEYTQAIDYIKRSMEWRQKTSIETGIAVNLKYLGFIYYELGRTELALDYLKRALKRSQNENDRVSQTQVLQRLYEIYTAENDYQTALGFSRQYIALRDSILNIEVSNRIASMEIQAEIREQEQKNEALSHENRIKALKLEKSQETRKLMALGIGLGVFIILMVIKLYRSKIRENQTLNKKNAEISAARQLLEKEIEERKAIELEREKLIHELQDSLSKIRTMSGLIPICASCKKIRNDDGFYEQVEKYIMDHSDAVFSHGICPECMEKLYGYLDDANQPDTNKSDEPV